MPTQTGDQFAKFPPSTFDRADGIDGRPGTATPADAVMPFPSATFFEEESDSPEIERAEQGTIVHKFRCDQDTAYAIISSIGRGYTLEDSFGNTSRVVNSRLTFQKGIVCGIQITAESLNWDWPIDEFSLEVTELNPAIEKHPRYNLLTYQDRINVHGAVQAEGIEFQGMYQAIIDTIPVDPTYGLLPRQQAQELAFKLHKAEDSFYLPGFRIQYSQYFSIPVVLNPGGYIEDPITSGELPFYFWNTDAPQTINQDNNIFLAMAIINPTIYENGIDWLRLCDTIQYQRTWFRVTSTWQGGPLGHWDQQLYTVPSLPYQTKETDGIVIRP
jgi:hypothetical protein